MHFVGAVRNHKFVENHEFKQLSKSINIATNNFIVCLTMSKVARMNAQRCVCMLCFVLSVKLLHMFRRKRAVMSHVYIYFNQPQFEISTFEYNLVLFSWSRSYSTPPGPWTKARGIEQLKTFVQDQFGGTGKVGDWARFNTLKESYPQTNWVLAGGLSPSNVLEALASTAADHLDINSGVETAPGIKDGTKLREAFKMLR